MVLLQLPSVSILLSSTDYLTRSAVRVGSLTGKNHQFALTLIPTEGCILYHPLLPHLPPRMDQMPSMQHLPGSVIGLGSLPTQHTETGATPLPDERTIQEKPIIASSTRFRIRPLLKTSRRLV
ncbi:hypothetical protein BKA70DRAFT_1286310 [Coprinopsis sp. MPI-PUGE-AT-0042]|nr:hypothetical protein BKA70DRAFT_1286310 [Coprinopsis sp. MPI-PUGE-AT-0042]